MCVSIKTDYFIIYLVKVGDVMFLLLIIFLVTLDLFSKILISTQFMDVSFSLFNGALKFSPYLNTHSMSLFNGLLLDLDLSLKSLILMNIVILILLFPIYLYLKSIDFKNIFVSIILILLVSGTIASTIDRLLWGGSLDFILISDYIIDFKDIYLFASILIAILYMLKSLISYFFKTKRNSHL